MSWSRSHAQSLRSRISQFFTHRFFRIAPLYFLAIIFYWFFEHLEPGDFRIQRLLATLLFYNAWSPYLIPTVGGWKPVPGGWSISVEFMFYFLFPLLALAVTTMRRAVLFAVISYLIMLVAAFYGPFLYPEISSAARNHFLFFWPPNQLIIFSIGFLLYRCIRSEKVRAFVDRSRLDANGATAILGAAVLLLQFYDRDTWPLLSFLLPLHVLLSALFAGWALFMILKPTSLSAPAAVVNIGKMSFSIYLLHFAGLGLANMLMVKVWPFGITGVFSIPYAGLLLIAATVVSYQAARITYRYIELPFIKFGKSLHAGTQAKSITPLDGARS
jgi:peptidoglycan/LPS O-acetylase OafA/YrhL